MPHLFVNRPRQHDLLGHQPSERDNLRWETINTGVYLVGGVMFIWGSVLFAVGSVFFMSAVGWTAAGAMCFIIGSLLFVCGAVINVLQVIRAPDLRILQFMNLTAITFVTGSVLFLVATIPYLFSLQSTADTRTVDAFLASQYVVGSALFLLGGSFNYLRARIVAHRQGGRPFRPPIDTLSHPVARPQPRPSLSCEKTQIDLPRLVSVREAGVRRG